MAVKSKKKPISLFVFTRKYADELGVVDRTIYKNVELFKAQLIEEGIIRIGHKINRTFYEVVDEDRLYDFFVKRQIQLRDNKMKKVLEEVSK